MLNEKKVLTETLEKVKEHEESIADLNSKIIKNNYGNGTASASINSSHAIKVGNVVFLSADVDITSNMTNAMSIPLVQLSELIPSITGDEQYIPSVINIRKSGIWESWTTHARIKKYPNGNHYLEQTVTNTLNNGDKVCFFVVFTTA